MLSVSEAREPLALVVPAYYAPTVSYKTIRQILEAVFRDSEVFCRRERLLAVVDRKTKAEEGLCQVVD